ncbi:MAG TPA: anthranilate phosphoribosyltransferase [Nitrospiraceae bacterium]|nr:MAG: anthranilate phosphoribosyltransferase [Nitrospirae bacterium GWA2_46_11]OGW25091.1 MAG: anthranilate phosphoribosyltransferase [Nitrospirae bacterium GWB2_47_37]HAK88031.1 anthranilate phosphoribosyltransferase [Nitrospiraceae bacterium]HCZ12077.1 anthranilate phosphoribosyltransferase [Nitrospiraceae bacterium]
MIKEAISLIIQDVSLSESEMAACMTEIMEGKATDAQIASFLTALRIKGETVEEITGAARIMREKATKINAPEGVIDTCGTGGDMSGTFNISTTTAIIVAASGIPVAKHGNRSVSSRSGSADVLEALGVNIELPPEKVEKCIFETNFGFLFAPLFHPAMKFAIGPRREIGIRTIFNILGPLTNPANAKRQILGVFADKLTEPLASVLGNLGAADAMVVHGEDGLDEITICDGTRVSRYRDGKVETSYITPEDFGFKRADCRELTGGDKKENADITLSVLNGGKGPRRDIVIMNSAAAIVVSGLAQDFKTAKDIAEETIDSKKALQKLEEIKKITSSL